MSFGGKTIDSFGGVWAFEIEWKERDSGFQLKSAFLATESYIIDDIDSF